VALIRERKTEVQKVADMLMEKETITHDDIMDAIGARPFEGDKQYKEYVSMRKQMREEDASTEEGQKDETNADEEEEQDDRGFTPTPGIA